MEIRNLVNSSQFLISIFNLQELKQTEKRMNPIQTLTYRLILSDTRILYLNQTH